MTLLTFLTLSPILPLPGGENLSHAMEKDGQKRQNCHPAS